MVMLFRYQKGHNFLEGHFYIEKLNDELVVILA